MDAETLTGRQALVFGASGQIGSAVVERLLAAGWQVLAVSRRRQDDRPGLRWLQGDLAGVAGVPATVAAVISCGPLDHFARWLSCAAVQAGQVIAFGSTSVHVKQDSPDAEERGLAARLAEAEVLLQAQVPQRAAAITLLRPTLVWGAGSDHNVSRIAAMAMRVGGFALPASARGRRQPEHVQDLAQAVMAVLASPGRAGRAYDLPGGETLEYRQMVRRVLDALPRRARLLVVPDGVFSLMLRVAWRLGRLRGFSAATRERMGQDLVFDAGPAREDLGWAPRGFAPTAAELGVAGAQ